MSQLSEQDLKQQIKEKDFSNIYFIYGEEGYLKQHYVQQILSKVVDEAFETFNLHRFEGKDTCVQEIAQAAQALPMMAEKSCVLVHDFPLDTMPASEKELLQALLKEKNETCVLIFWMDFLEVDPKKNSKWRSLINLFAKHASCVELGRKDTASLARLLMNGAKKRSCILSLSNAQYLVQTVGSQMQLLLGELEKLCSYIQEGEISRTLIDEMTTKSLEAKVFDLTKAILKNHLGQALQILNQLWNQKEDPVSILAVISTGYVDLYRVKIAKIAGLQAVEVGKYFQYKGKEFRLRNASRDASVLHVEQLRRSLDILCDADGKLKSSSGDKRFILENTLFQLSLVSRG